MNSFSKLFKKPIISLFNYFNLFEFNFKPTVKKIDYMNNKVSLFFRGSKDIVHLNIFDVFYDSSLISSLHSLISFEIGYICGVKFGAFSNLSNSKSFDYSIIPDSKIEYNCTITSIDRKKNIIFRYVSSNTTKDLNISPIEFIHRSSLINQFHPIQACYIGLLAGCLSRSTDPLQYFRTLG